MRPAANATVQACSSATLFLVVRPGALIVASLLLVAMPFAPSSVLMLPSQDGCSSDLVATSLPMHITHTHTHEHIGAIRDHMPTAFERLNQQTVCASAAGVLGMVSQTHAAKPTAVYFLVPGKLGSGCFVLARTAEVMHVRRASSASKTSGKSATSDQWGSVAN